MEHQFSQDIEARPDEKERIQTIIKYWLGSFPFTNQDELGKDRFPLWFHSKEETDKFIIENFKDDLLKLAADSELLARWSNDKYGRLAAVLLCDQMSRNMFRKQKQAFDYDHIALGIVNGMKQEDLEQYYLTEKTWFLLPLEHAEDLEMQEKCVRLFQKYVDQAQEMADLHPSQKFMLKGGVDYAVQHKVIIEKFGRFPHRNEVMGRESTDEEIEYLKTAQRYGQ